MRTASSSLPADERQVVTALGDADPADREQPVGGNALGLALQLERLDRLDLDGVAHEPVGRLADQHLVGRRRLLEPRRDVDRVAR